MLSYKIPKPKSNHVDLGRDEVVIAKFGCLACSSRAVSVRFTERVLLGGSEWVAKREIGRTRLSYARTKEGDKLEDRGQPALDDQNECDQNLISWPVDFTENRTRSW